MSSPTRTPEPGSRRRYLMQSLREQLEDIQRLTSELSEQQMAIRHDVNKCSLKESVAHLYRCQELCEGNIVAMATERNPTLADFDDGSDPKSSTPESSAQDLMVAFSGNRLLLLAQFASFSEAEWMRPGKHPQFGNITVEKQLEYMLYHEAHHIYEMIGVRAKIGKGTAQR